MRNKGFMVKILCVNGLLMLRKQSGKNDRKESDIVALNLGEC